MASPPPTLSLPKKRPQISLPSAPAPKRRKPSIASASSHPLRQTSFPPPDRSGLASNNNNGGGGGSEVYSPGSLPDDYEDDEIASAVGSVAASNLDGVASSVVSGRGGRGKTRGKRGGRGGGRGGRGRGDTGSVVSDGATGVGRGSKGPGTAAEGEDEEEEEGDEEDGDLLEGGKLGRERLEEEKERRAMFLGSLLALAEDGGVAVPEEMVREEGMGEEEVRRRREMRKRKVQEIASINAQRYELWNRIHLKKEVVRRLTNQTLSQSVPQSVVTAISAYSKVFVGEIVDRALQVQMEWTAARIEGEKVEKAKKAQSKRDDSVEILDGPNGAATEDGQGEKEGKVGTHGVRHAHVDERDVGPLLPDHLREALRRYKADREGGVVGFTGLSLEGRENAASRNGGKRLFR